MRILFCNIAWMKYYKGDAKGNDHPQGGGSFVAENQYAHEEFNFHPVNLSNEGFGDEEYCLGFVETKSTNHETMNQLKIEKISGCSLCTGEDSVEDVTVVYCARYPWSEKRETVVVGWYGHATVFRTYEEIPFEEGRLGREGYTQYYNAIARKEDCVLLPISERRQNRWNVPRKSAKYAKYGFGQSNVWFANDIGNEELQNFLRRIEEGITSYSGEDWLNKYPEA